MIKAVIFDMDGLMIDSERVKLHYRNIVKKDLGYSDDNDIMSETFGKTKTEIKRIYINKYGPDYPIEEISHRTNVLWMDYLNKNGVPIKKGLKELLEFLKDNDYKIGVATSTYKDEAEYLLTEANIAGYFDTIATGERAIRSKPYPDLYLEASRLLSVDPEVCLVLEDSPNGVKSAFNAGMKVIMVPDLIEPTDQIREISSYVVDGLADVIPILKDECQ